MPKKIYFDYQATTPVSENVLKKMLPYFTKNFGNPHSNNHEFGRVANEAVEDARSIVAKMINAQSNEIIFTSGATESNNFVIKSIAKNFSTKDFQIITCLTEHKCILESCYQMEKEGYKVIYLEVNQEGLLNLEILENYLKEKKSLVSLMSANNEIGVCHDVSKIGELCEKYGAIFHSDIAQSVGTQKIDIESMKINAASLSGHKIYGPKGIGALFVSNSIKNLLRPMISGGGQEMGLRSGTLSPALCVGLGEACNDLIKNRKKYFEHFKKLKSCLLSELIKSKLDFEINGSVEKRIPNNLNISIRGKTAEQLFNFIPQFALSSGSACTSGSIERSHVLSALNLEISKIDESFRISFGRNSTKPEIKKLILSISKII